MSHCKVIVRGATTAVTKRTNMRKAFLAPWHPEVDRICLYSLAYAQHKTDVAVHHMVRPVNHDHLTVTPARSNLPDFVGRFHHDVSCALNTLLARERYDAPRELFDSRDPHYMRLVDAEAQATWGVYQHNNCVAAGLVARPEHMPGVTFDFELWKKRYLEVERPDVFFSEDRPEVLQLEVTPPPLLYEAFGGDLDALVAHMQQLAEDNARQLRAKQTRGPLGAQRLQRLHPWSEPRTLRETGGKAMPSFRVGARGIVGQQRNIECAREVRRYRGRHRGTRIARRDGDLTASYPFGTYKARVVEGAPVDPEPQAGEAIVAAPGPLLCEVEQRLAEAGRDATATAQRTAELIEKARTALHDEAEVLVEHSQDEVGQLRQDAAARAARDGKRPVQTRHRFERRDTSDSTDAKRVVTLRDRRRGRPSAKHRHGADPPG